MDTVTVTHARQNLYHLVNETNKSHTPIQIMGKQGSAVLLSYEDWKAIEETLYLTNRAGMLESIKEGKAESTQECIDTDEIEW